MLSLCNDWQFTENWFDGFARGEGDAAPVRLPHTVKELPLHYADHKAYQMVCGYRKTLPWDASYAGKRLFVQFDGAAHIATVYLNGKELTTHRCGYTAFRVEITDVMEQGENILAVKLDTTENPEIPPFGFVIDYLTYGGLYREVWLDLREQRFLEDLYITTPTVTSLKLDVAAVNGDGCFCRIEILNAENKLVQLRTVAASDSSQSIN